MTEQTYHLRMATLDHLHWMRSTAIAMLRTLESLNEIDPETAKRTRAEITSEFESVRDFVMHDA